jgi:hypothetical protein
MADLLSRRVEGIRRPIAGFFRSEFRTVTCEWRIRDFRRQTAASRPKTAQEDERRVPLHHLVRSKNSSEALPVHAAS